MPDSPARRATFEDLINKPVRTKEIQVNTSDEGSEPISLTIVIRALGAKDYDHLLAQHPPTSKQKAEGSNFNIDTFAPALLSRCAVEPVLTYEEATEVFASSSWSGGEVGGLFMELMKLCNEGVNVPFGKTV